MQAVNGEGKERHRRQRAEEIFLVHVLPCQIEQRDVEDEVHNADGQAAEIVNDKAKARNAAAEQHVGDIKQVDGAGRNQTADNHHCITVNFVLHGALLKNFD